jgi:murein DD-endopeptidase MepM/ murein hydrolase activator NlpD
MQGMELLGGGGQGEAVPVMKGQTKAAAGIIGQGGPANLGGGALPSSPAPAATPGATPGATPDAADGPSLPEGVPQPSEAYNAAKPPAPVAAATANWSKASGVQPLYDVGKLLQTGLYYQTIGAKYNLPQASEIGKTLSSQAQEFIKQGQVPVRLADGSTGIAPIPGYLQKVYAEHAAENSAKWNEYGSKEKGAERANTRDRLNALELAQLARMGRDVSAALAEVSQAPTVGLRPEELADSIGGMAPTPTSQPVTAKAGPRSLPASGRVRTQGLGVRIMATSGSRVRAGTAGEVLYAGPFKQLGGLVIVATPEGDDVVLANLATLQVLPGDVVTPEQVLGTVGEGGVYWEIRRKGRAIKPQVWLNRENAI